MKKTISLTESDLHRIVKETVKSVLNENFYQKRDDYLDALEDNKYYSDEFGREMLQLSDKRVLWDINNENFDFDEYCIECDYALKKLSEKYGTEFYLLGRSGRHVCVEDTKENRKRFYKMQKDVEEMQNEIISKFSNVNENSKLRRIVKESVKKMLNEWSFQKFGYFSDIEDWPMVNDENDGTDLYKVSIWSGVGYGLDCFRVWSDSDDFMEILEKVVAYLDREGDKSLFIDDDVDKEIEKLESEGYSEDEIQDKIEDWACYVDATEYGASEPHFVFWENLGVEKFPNEYMDRGKNTVEK